VRSVCVGYIYTNALTEATFGKKVPRFPLRELGVTDTSPFSLNAGESFTWNTDLYQLEESVDEGKLVVGPHPPLMDLKHVEEELVRGIRPGLLTVKARNIAVSWSFRRLAVVLVDDKDILYKIKVRWQPPGVTPPDLPNSSLSRA
jgi:hypothetical protein